MSTPRPQILLAQTGTAAARQPYETVMKALRQMSPDDIVEAIASSGLRGRGGAGFPAGFKWKAVAAEESDEKFVVANGAEGEPGCFKDRHLMLNRPHLVVAGAILACYAVGAHKGYIYIHHEAEDCMASIAGALREAHELGLLGENVLGTGRAIDVVPHVAGVGYVAGEETAVLQFIEGKPAKPKAKPPYPTHKGLWGKPTLVNNIETLSNVEPIVREGAAWYRSIGTADTVGTLLLSLNGVKRPGVYEVAAGTPLKEAIFDLGGGPVAGKVKAVLPGGYAASFLTAEDLDVALEFGAMKECGSLLGAAAIHVFDDSLCMVEVARKVMKFFAAETCGQCFPCHKGTRQFFVLAQDAERGEGTPEWNETLDAVYKLTGRKTLCGLDKAATAAMRSALELFGEEFDHHLNNTTCQACCSGGRS